MSPGQRFTDSATEMSNPVQFTFTSISLVPPAGGGARTPAMMIRYALESTRDDVHAIYGAAARPEEITNPVQFTFLFISFVASTQYTVRPPGPRVEWPCALASHWAARREARC